MAVQYPLTPSDSDRVSRLPAWARNTLDTLTGQLRGRDQEIAELKAEVARLHAAQSGGLDVTTIANPYGELPYPIGDNPMIEHRLADGGRFTLTLTGDGIEVSNSSAMGGAIVVQPASSNVVTVRRAQ